MKTLVSILARVLQIAVGVALWRFVSGTADQYGNSLLANDQVLLADLVFALPWILGAAAIGLTFLDSDDEKAS